ncbi:MAG: 2-dehydropantoate 2-reductase [Beijerinckiaceae bacterium]|jgi:2-dehydropantoate 2-reductase|nr:2-dehydropantoate 2-reductase [Beijerinckiaceae bacterium]
MKILVAGIGGIGGWLAGTLARGGADVTLYARGLTLARLREDGLVVQSGEKSERFRLPVWDGQKSLAAQDMVLICVKAQDFGAIAETIAPVFFGKPRVSAVVNGLPYWFLDGLDTPFGNRNLETIDPGGKARKVLDGIKPLGSVVHGSAAAIEPGVIRIAKVDRFIIGEPDGRASEEASALAGLCEAGGVSAPVVDNIRTEIWAKLWGNMSVNPLSALTQLTTTPLHTIPETRALIVSLMEEFELIGKRLGLRLPMGVEERIAVTEFLGDFRTSMLADLQAGRRLETDGIMGCIIELADRLGEDAPSCRAVYAMIKGLDHALSVGR